MIRGGKTARRTLHLDLTVDEFEQYQKLCDQRGVTYVGYFRQHLFATVQAMKLMARLQREIDSLRAALAAKQAEVEQAEAQTKLASLGRHRE